jgi:glycosyltransferase involved in cell wall biosynthesis
MGGTNVVALARARIAAGEPTHVITLDPRVDRRVDFENGPLRYTICPRRMRCAQRSAYGVERRYLAEVIRESQPDVIHANWTYEYAMGALDTRLPTLITVRDHAGSILRWSGWRYLPHFIYTHYVFRRGRWFTAVSPYNAAYAAKWTGREVTVIPNGLPSGKDCYPEEPEISKERPDVLKIASALSDAPFKNARRALLAIRDFRRKVPNLQYVLMGPGLEKGGELYRWAEKQGAHDGVAFLGGVPHARVLEEFRQCDIMFHPSLEECCNNAVVEALGMGKIVVGARGAGGTPWVLNGGRAGFLVDARSEQDMVSVLNRIYSHWSEAREIAAGGLQLARRRYSPARIMGMYEQVYEQVLS